MDYPKNLTKRQRIGEEPDEVFKLRTVTIRYRRADYEIVGPDSRESNTPQPATTS